MYAYAYIWCTFIYAMSANIQGTGGRNSGFICLFVWALPYNRKNIFAKLL